MLDKLRKFLTHPGFQAAPITVLGRGLALVGLLARGTAPRFALFPGGPLVEVPADRRYTTVANYLMRDQVEPELAALQRFLGPGDVLVDVGANIGLFSLKGGHLVGEAGLVLAVEPGATSLSRLSDNLALNNLPMVRIVRAALSDHEGEMALFHIPLGDDPQAFSLIPGGGQVPSEMVRVTTLDTLVQTHGLTRLDCVKIDVEGAEPMVLAGGRATLERFHPIVIFEVNAPLAEATGDSSAAANTLIAMGYRLHALRGEILEPLQTVPQHHCNLVAVHPQGRQPG